MGALEDFRRATDLDPTAERWFLRGMLLREMNALNGENEKAVVAEAILSLSNCVELDPKQSEAFFWKGQLEINRLEDFESALRDFDRACAIDPRAQYLAHRGLTHVYLKHYAEAGADLDKAVALEPRTTLFLRWRSELHAETRDYDAAIRDIEEIDRIEGTGGQQREMTFNHLDALRKLAAEKREREGR
jgi:tetratricopeptide (TPR) repeat protein